MIHLYIATVLGGLLGIWLRSIEIELWGLDFFIAIGFFVTAYISGYIAGMLNALKLEDYNGN